MNGLINNQGGLELMRNGVYKKQACPYSALGGKYNLGCGDWCPMFREPQKVNSLNAKRGYTSLRLCNGNELVLHEFIDQRQQTRDFKLVKEEAEANWDKPFTVEEAAAYTGYSKDTLYVYAGRGTISSYKVGNRRMFTRQHLDLFLSKCKRARPDYVAPSTKRSGR